MPTSDAEGKDGSLAPKKTTAKRVTAKKTTSAPRRKTAPKPAPSPKPATEGAPRFAVIGTGRSGTGHVAALLQANGINCGHEGWFKPEERTPGLDGDASWLAVPEIEDGTWKGPVAHVARHPVAVVRSLMGIRFFHDELRDAPYPQFARQHLPAIVDLPPLEAAVEWWVQWNERCAQLADVKLRVEDLRQPWAIAELGQALGVQLDPAVSARVPANTNSRERANTPQADVWRLLDGRAARFGYRA
jgi:hypothetical protein